MPLLCVPISAVVRLGHWSATYALGSHKSLLVIVLGIINSTDSAYNILGFSDKYPHKYAIMCPVWGVSAPIGACRSSMADTIGAAIASSSIHGISLSVCWVCMRDGAPRATSAPDGCVVHRAAVSTQTRPCYNRSTPRWYLLSPIPGAVRLVPGAVRRAPSLL